jgi:tRNA G18 (ribose-2'-O)-methylase SpoU
MQDFTPIRQLEHEEVQNTQRKFPVRVICNDITSAENVGMIFRISEAMGVEQIHLCGSTPTTENKKLLRTSRSTEKNVGHSHVEDISALLEKLKGEGFTIASLEITNKSRELSSIDFKPMHKIAIVVGNEQYGVQHEVLNKSDLTVEIKMYGKNTSINVVNSLSIMLYEVTRQLSVG